LNKNFPGSSAHAWQDIGVLKIVTVRIQAEFVLAEI
jgi:hypothetical protein